MVIRIDQRSRTGSILDIEIVHGVESFNPAILCQVVKIQTNSATQNCISRRAESISDAQPRCEGFVVVMRDPRDESIASQGRIRALVVPRRFEETERGVVAQSVVDGQMRNDAPGVLSVNPQSLHVLREAPIASGICGATDTLRRRRNTIQVEIKLGRIGGVETRILRVGKNRFWTSGER